MTAPAPHTQNLSNSETEQILAAVALPVKHRKVRKYKGELAKMEAIAKAGEKLAGERLAQILEQAADLADERTALRVAEAKMDLYRIATLLGWLLFALAVVWR